MPSTINADNGVVSGSSGVKTTADTSGVLALQSNGSTGLTLDTSLNVGVGMTPVYKLDVTGGNGNAIRFTDSVNSVQVATGAYNSTGFFGTLSNHPQLFYTNSSEKMRLDTSGNLGLGVAPYAWTGGKAFDLALYGTLNTWDDGALSMTQLGTNYYQTGSTFNYKVGSSASMYRLRGNVHSWFTAPSGTAGNAITFTEVLKLQNVSQQNMTLAGTNASLLINAVGSTYPGIFLLTSGTSFAQFSGDGTNAAVGANGYLQFMTNGYGTERARIDTSGNLLLGTTTANGTNGITFASLGATTPYGLINQTASGTLMFFRYNSTTVGSITQNTTSTTYATSSDYRLKNSIAPMTGALSKVALLKPVTYKWNADGSDGEGFIAHELAEVCPDAVTGTKDAVETYVDEDGNEQTRPVYQGIDTSFLVATLTAAIQELKAELDLVKSELATLKGNP